MPIDFIWILQAAIDSQGADDPGFASADLGNSAVWLGITALDANGAIIPDLQITSESGENWLLPGVVPEPASFWLAFAAVTALIGIRHRALRIRS